MDETKCAKCGWPEAHDWHQPGDRFAHAFVVPAPRGEEKPQCICYGKAAARYGPEPDCPVHFPAPRGEEKRVSQEQIDNHIRQKFIDYTDTNYDEPPAPAPSASFVSIHKPGCTPASARCDCFVQPPAVLTTNAPAPSACGYRFKDGTICTDKPDHDHHYDPAPSADEVVERVYEAHGFRIEQPCKAKRAECQKEHYIVKVSGPFPVTATIRRTP
jgi:hypothetical protein